MAEFIKLVGAGQLVDPSGRLTKGIVKILFVNKAQAADFNAACAKAPDPTTWDLGKPSASTADVDLVRGNPDWEEVEAPGEGMTLFKHIDRVFGT